MGQANGTSRNHGFDAYSAFSDMRQARPETARWQPMFSAGIGCRNGIEDYMFEFGRNVGRFCTVVPRGWGNINQDCDSLAYTLQNAVRDAGRKAVELKDYLSELPAHRRINPTVRIVCDITQHKNLRCQVIPDFNGHRGPSGFTSAAAFDTPDSYFLHLTDISRVFAAADNEYLPVVLDVAAMIVTAFNQCVDAFRKDFIVQVRTAPALNMEWGGPRYPKRVNVGLVVESPTETAAKEEARVRLDEIAKSDGLLASFSDSFPNGSPEQFVLFVEAAPAKDTRISVVRELGRIGYVSSETNWMLNAVRAERGRPEPFRFDNRNLMSRVAELTKTLNRVRPDWRSAPVQEPPKKARRLNQRGR